MWPFYFLLNKILNVEWEYQEQEKTDESGLGFANSVESRHSVQLLGDGICRDLVLPCSHFVEAPYVSQLHDWDCGLACVLMVLKTFGVDNCSIEDLADLCHTRSVWTVDLAYLLHKFYVQFSYFTVTLGANPNYSDENFYKDQLSTDAVRVEMLFQKAREEGIDIQCRSINEKEISLYILSGKYVAIALVNQYKLRSRSWVNDILLSSSNSYAGHYIVICGYDASLNEFEIADPASNSNHERISAECLEEARKSFGTDEDLLLISLEKIDNINDMLQQLITSVSTSL